METPEVPREGYKNATFDNITGLYRATPGTFSPSKSLTPQSTTELALNVMCSIL